MMRSDLHFVSDGMPNVGDQVGVHRITGVISLGPDAVVYDAAHLGLGFPMPVAVKVLRTTAAGTVDGLRAAVQGISRFGGPHIVRIFDVGELPSHHPYIVMDRLQGESLKAHLARHGALSIGVAAEIVGQLCLALGDTHRANVVHGDLRPSSVVVRPRPDGGLHAAIIGFERPPGGSPGYASPEQLGHSELIDARADVWALGLILFEMMTGRRAFPFDTFDVMRIAALQGVPAPMTSPHGQVPEDLEAIIRRCTAPNRQARFASVAELAAALAPHALRSRSSVVRSPAPSSAAETVLAKPLPVLHEDVDNPSTGRTTRKQELEQTVVRPPLARTQLSPIAPLQATTVLPPLQATTALGPQPKRFAGTVPLSMSPLAAPLPMRSSSRVLAAPPAYPPPSQSQRAYHASSYPPPMGVAMDADPVVLSPDVLPQRSYARYLLVPIVATLVFVGFVHFEPLGSSPIIAVARAHQPPPQALIPPPPAAATTPPPEPSTQPAASASGAPPLSRRPRS
jgi:serine/threonine-protein kinase